jgi:hypothetical protein
MRSFVLLAALVALLATGEWPHMHGCGCAGPVADGRPCTCTSRTTPGITEQTVRAAPDRQGLHTCCDWLWLFPSRRPGNFRCLFLMQLVWPKPPARRATTGACSARTISKNGRVYYSASMRRLDGPLRLLPPPLPPLLCPWTCLPASLRTTAVALPHIVCWQIPYDTPQT